MEQAIAIMPPADLAAAAFHADLFERFVQYSDVKELTMRGYITGLKAFSRWLSDSGITQPTRQTVKDFKKHLDESAYKPGTRANYMRTVKHFFKWTASEGLYPNVADNIKGVRIRQDNTKRDAFAADDMRAVLAGIDRGSVVGKRDYAMILLSVTCALRIIEMHRANISDLQTLHGERILYIQGKGHDDKDAFVKIPAEVDAALNDYLQTRPGLKKSEPLFVGTSNRAKGARITEPRLSMLIKERFKAAGYDYEKLTAHSLRHTGVTSLLLANGSNIQQARSYARHANINTTLIYSHNIEREKDHSEEMVYDYLFGTPGTATNAADEAAALLKTMTREQAGRVLAFMHDILKEADCVEA